MSTPHLPCGPWTSAITPADRAAPLRLLCLPHAGGSAHVYRPWVAALRPHVAVVPVHLPGHDRRISETPHRSAQPLVAAMAAALSPLLTSPYALFGHSMGGLLAFELAHELRRQGQPPARLLWISGTDHPALPPRRSPIHHLPSDAFFDALRRMNGTPAEVLDNRELREMFEPVLRADFTLCETHGARPEPPLAMPLVVSTGDLDDLAPPDAMGHWRESTTATFEALTLPGDHFYLHRPDSALLPALQTRLNRYVSAP